MKTLGKRQVARLNKIQWANSKVKANPKSRGEETNFEPTALSKRDGPEGGKHFVKNFTNSHPHRIIFLRSRWKIKGKTLDPNRLDRKHYLLEGASCI
jgi:hypothetical protein